MRSTRSLVHALTDAFVRALALFSLCNIVLGLISPELDANWLWIQGGALPPTAVQVLVGLFALGVLVLRQPFGGRQGA